MKKLEEFNRLDEVSVVITANADLWRNFVKVVSRVELNLELERDRTPETEAPRRQRLTQQSAVLKVFRLALGNAFSGEVRKHGQVMAKIQPKQDHLDHLREAGRLLENWVSCVDHENNSCVDWCDICRAGFEWETKVGVWLGQ